MTDEPFTGGRARPTVWVAVMTATVILCTLLPFLPGGYDPLAFPFSAMARTAGMAGLLFVPVGLAWLLWGRPGAPPRTYGRLAVATLVVSAMVLAVVSVAALAFGGMVLGIAAIGVSLSATAKGWAIVRAARDAGVPLVMPIPAYMILVPATIVALQGVLVPRAVAAARSRAIANSSGLIADLEAYRAVHGRYPASLLAVTQDYKPGVIGIRKYEYESSGETFNLVFEQPPSELSAREVIAFNPRGEQEATSHDSDLLRRSAAELVHWRGYFSVQDVAPNWKLFRFD